MTERTCTIDGCDRKHRARGLCVTHYNGQMGKAKRHPRVTTACVVCTAPVRRRADSTYAPTCSTSCRTIVQWGEHQAQTDTYAWRHDAVKRAHKHGCTVIEAFDREEIFERDAWCCQSCGIQCSTPNPFDRTAATVDHVKPLHLGGDHSKANAQTLCLSCNARKQARTAAA